MARNNAYRFASHAVALAGAEGGVLETMAGLMLEAMRALPEIREVDDDLVAFVRAVSIYVNGIFMAVLVIFWILDDFWHILRF